MNETHQKNPTRHIVHLGKTHSDHEMTSRHTFFLQKHHQEVNESEIEVITETIEQGKRE